MNSIARRVLTLWQQPSRVTQSLNCGNHQLEQWRGIRVKVRNGNLEQALALMQRKMQASGIERLIKNQQTHHIKNSQRKVLARKFLQMKIRSQDLARKLQAVLVKKVRGM